MSIQNLDWLLSSTKLSSSRSLYILSEVFITFAYKYDITDTGIVVFDANVNKKVIKKNQSQ